MVLSSRLDTFESEVCCRVIGKRTANTVSKVIAFIQHLSMHLLMFAPIAVNYEAQH
jgi:hypothetical protein